MEDTADRVSDPPESVRSSRVLAERPRRTPRKWAFGVLLGVWQPRADQADRWIVQLRWLAVVGMATTVGVGKVLVPSLAIGPPFAVLGFIAALNAYWTWRVRRREVGDETPVPDLVALQIGIDVVALTAMLWVTGGTTNPFAGFLTFQVALAGLLTTPRRSLGIAVLAIASIGVLTQARVLDFEGAALGKDRTAAIAEATALVAHAAFLGFFVFVFATRLEQLRDEANRNEKLAVLGKLVGGMCHELATPVATILLAGKDLAASDLGDPDLSRLAGTVAGEAQRASEILGLMRGQIRPDPTTEQLDVRAFVRSVAEAELDRAGFVGKRVLPAAQPLEATILKSGVAQVLVNAVKNAVDATTDRGESARIAVQVEEVLGEVTIVVEDNGPGFAPEVLERLGEPFQTTKQEQGGLGLGLYTCSMLAQRMEGTLRIDSEAGRGARVVLSVPMS